MEEICQLHAQEETSGTKLMSTDEQTGIQALERAGATLPLQSGKVEKREHNYIRHGTPVLTANFCLHSGQIIAPTIADTRKEADFLVPIQQTVATAPHKQWIFIVDQLNTHMSASLVAWVAEMIKDPPKLGKKGSSGILKNKKSRKSDLSKPQHRIRFVYTPKHCSWLNPIENWFSSLTKRVIKRGNFTSKQDLKEKRLNYIQCYNQRLVKKYQWTNKTRNTIDSMLNKIKKTVTKLMT